MDVIKTYLLTSDNIFEDEIPDNWVGGYMDPWNQDKMLFLENNKKVEVHAADGLWGLPHKLSQKFLTRGIKESDVWLKTACGNYFAGKKENGEKYEQRDPHRHALFGQKHLGRAASQAVGLRFYRHRPADPTKNRKAPAGNSGYRGSCHPPPGKR